MGITADNISERIQLFKDKITDLSEFNNYEDCRLEKWLRVTNYDVDKTERMLRNSIEFKRKMDVDTLLDAYVPPKVLQDYFAGGFCGFDKEGSPVLVEMYGHLDMRGLMLSTKKVDFEKFELIKCEKTMKDWDVMSRKLGKKIDGLTVIFDMDNVGPKSLWRPGLQMYLHCVRILEENYPDMMKRIFVVNAPKIFPILWKICRPLISDNLKETLHILGSDYKKVLLNYIDDENLPEYLGGKKVDPDGNGRCPSLICQGGIVPKNNYLTELAEDNDMNIVIVPKKETLELEFSVTVAGAIIKWDFMTEDQDISFGIQRIGENKEEDVLPKKKYECHRIMQDGHYVCSIPGTYKVCFDNTSSWTNPKKLYYTVDLHEDNLETGEIDSIINCGSSNWSTLSKDLKTHGQQ